jgi:hypothetical protein
MVRSLTLQIVLSAVAGFASVYALAALTLFFGHGSDVLFQRYTDVFGLVSVIVRLIDPSYYPREELGSELAHYVAGILRIVIWTSLFGLLYFRLVFRRRQPSNQAMQRTAPRSDA